MPAGRAASSPAGRGARTGAARRPRRSPGRPPSTRSISSSQRSSTSGLRASAQKIHVRKSWIGSGNWSLTVARSCSSVVTPSSAAWRTRRESWSTAAGSGASRRCSTSASTRSSMSALALRAPRPVGSRQSSVPTGWIRLGLPDVAGLERAQDRLVGLLARQLLPVGLEVQPAERAPDVDGLALAPLGARRVRAASRDLGRRGSFQIGRPSVSRWRSCSGPDVIDEDALAAVPARDAREAAAPERGRIVELERALHRAPGRSRAAASGCRSGPGRSRARSSARAWS